MQDPAPAAVKVAPEIVQLPLLDAYDNAPVPEPPVVLSIAVPR